MVVTRRTSETKMTRIEINDKRMINNNFTLFILLTNNRITKKKKELDFVKNPVFSEKVEEIFPLFQLQKKKKYFHFFI